MTSLSPTARAAISEIATTLGPAVTTSIIDGLARTYGLRLPSVNKANKIRLVLDHMCSDGRKRAQAEELICALTMEGHARALQKQCELFVEDIDRVVIAMRRLDLRVGGLGREECRTGLPRRKPVPSSFSTPGPQSEAVRSSAVPSSSVARPHTNVLEFLSEMSGGAMSAQHRGRQLEILLLEVLRVEGLSPEHRVVTPGEEMDLAFSVGGQHYLVECKWERSAVGLATLHTFVSKVNTKAEGTFGVLLSMSGFVDDINEKASRGRRLVAVGLEAAHFMNVLEGRTTWTQAVEKARQHASRRSLFFVPA